MIRVARLVLAGCLAALVGACNMPPPYQVAPVYAPAPPPLVPYVPTAAAPPPVRHYVRHRYYRHHYYHRRVHHYVRRPACRCVPASPASTGS
jgi:hypothetical protein